MFDNGCEYTNGELFLYNFLEKKCKIIFDIGIGENTYYPINNSITYHLFESYVPLFENFKNKNLEKNNIKINCMALGSEKKSLPFYFKNGMSFVNRSSTATSDLFIETNTLDNYIKSNNIDHIDFLKIDTEGWELNIIRGAIESLNKISHIQFEYGHTWIEGGFSLEEANNILSQHDFKLFIIVPDGIVRITKFSDHGRYCNYFGTRKIEDVKDIIHQRNVI